MSSIPQKSAHPLVLIADADVQVRVLIRATLESSGFAVEEAKNGREAISGFLRLRPQLVILDAGMPVMDGFETCFALRKLSATLPILVTSREDADSIRHAFDIGATDFATKPINMLLLGYRVRCMLRAAEKLTQLRRSEALRAAALRAAQIGHWEWNVESGVLCWSADVHEILGTTPADCPSTLDSFFGLVHEEDRSRLREVVLRAKDQKCGFKVQFRALSPDGVRIVLQQGLPVSDVEDGLLLFSGTVRDVTAERTAEAELHFLEHFDPLTHLPNRTMFRDWLDQAVARVAPNEEGVTVFILNLDAFKRINDSLGHGSGDTLLQKVTERLQDVLQWTPQCHRSGILEQDRILSRLGGDEFLLAQQNLSRRDVAKLARDLLESLERPFLMDRREVVMTGCLGISRQPSAGRDSTSLLLAAETALHDAKQKGWGSYEMFVPSNRTQPLVRLDKEVGLRRALENDELILHFQPQIDTETRQTVGVEALVRWCHPERGIIGPAGFLKLAEQTDLIIPLGEWVLRKACAQAAAWSVAMAPPVVMAVNVSPRQFSRSGLVASIRAALSDTGLPADRLELEITETLLMQNISEMAVLLTELRTMGVRVAIDDFGTGYSSLSYLRKLPIQTLKIDQSFVHDVGKDADNAAITATIIAMAHRLNLDVVAEGVETQEEYQVLRSQGCRVMQGYLFAKPLEADTCLAILRGALPWAAGPGST